MTTEKKLDITSNEPEPGDLVCFAEKSELIIGQVVEFNAQGYPNININGHGEPEKIVEISSNFVIVDMV